jgi:hypothetical protein
MTAWDPHKMKEMLEEQGHKNVKVEPSNITFSPHWYVNVYLTDKEHEGQHLILSEGAEHGEEGILCGEYPHFEENATNFEVRASMEDAAAWVEAAYVRD